MALLLGACSRPGGPDAIKDEFPIGGGGAGGITSVTRDLSCTPATSSQSLPARVSVISQMGGGADSNIMFTSDLFEEWRSVCGGCHYDSSLGNFHVTEANFAQQITQDVLNNRIESNDPNMVMPPYGVPFNHRDSTDAVVVLADLLQLWINQGSPADSFTLPSTDGTSGTAQYALSEQLGSALTNIGSCIPSVDAIGMNTSAMDALDQFFAQATDLPSTLDQTDLVTLDSDQLAQNGVISFAPGYPLWSDDAYKMRYVRVPRGQSIQFDKATQAFQIPPNTRFYKTFLRKIIDTDGSTTYRKIETRLIVSRPDQDNADGTVTQTALFGTYLWNDDETQATLLNEPLRDGKPFLDRFVTYVTDEPKAQSVIDSLPPGYSVQSALAQFPGLVRHYAVPGSQRCIQCHMGSPSKAFVLGFTPLQIARFPAGTNGVIEPSAGDELTQLDRLIKYKVVTGMTSAADVLPLEMSEGSPAGSRAPRNAQELTAQAYMLGNCAHCHNPRGFPSTKAPELKPVLNFLPSADGGIFQFPLDRTSPVRQRGPLQNIPIPYITPSLRDYPEQGATPKFFCPKDNPTSGACNTDGANAALANIVWISAPWRSLIYRNVDTPFDYVEDNTIFPHMPLNTPGYDCRTRQLLGDWMVSIPATLIHPNLSENALPDDSGNYPANSNVNNDPQPYMEVMPTDPGYADAVTQAGFRLNAFHAGLRYTMCPDTSDTIDPVIQEEVARNLPVDPDTGIVYDPNDPTKVIFPDLGIPLRPNWIITDPTDPPGDWNPRRPDWSTAIVDHTDVGSGVSGDDLIDLDNVISKLSALSLTTDVRTQLTTSVPFGLWSVSTAQQANPSCQFPANQQVGYFRALPNHPVWMDDPTIPDSKPVYSQSPGAAIFTSICINCHGPLADAKGLLADEITLMTGGDARVADLRDGLFGPVTAPGTNRTRIFGDAATSLAVTPDDIGARYMAWMALGGTTKHLPTPLLNLVSQSPMLGQFRGPKLELAGSPDMLRLGLKLCLGMLPGDPNNLTLSMDKFVQSGWLDWGNQTGLIDKNGDAEMWLMLCNQNNPPVVRVLQGGNVSAAQLFWGDAYPSDAPVMDQYGHVTNGIQPGNYFPLCNQGAAGPTVTPHGGGTAASVPACPTALLATDPQTGQGLHQLNVVHDLAGNYQYVDHRIWAARGAINAAAAVFLYLDGVTKGTITPQPPYNQCDKR